MRLVYSPDDSGWYFERFSDWATSQLFKSQSLALFAKRHHQLVWSK